MPEVAALGVRAYGDGIDTTVVSLNRLKAAAAGAEKAADGLADGTKKTADESKALKNPVDQATDAVEDLGKESKGTAGYLDRMAGAQGRATSSSNKLAGALGTMIARLAAMAAGALSVRAYQQYADAWSDMQSRVGAAVKNMDAAPELMMRMVNIANASYSSLSQTAEVYARNVSVLGGLGYAAEQAADYTESLNHMLVITATKGEQAASVQNALSKAMALGKLNGEGLESVMANGGRVAEALAKALNTNVNGLRAFASQGKITSKVIAGALLDSLQQVREEAAAMPATIADGFQRIGTGIQAIIGTFDQATGVSGRFADMLVTIGDVLADVARYIFDNGELIRTVFETGVNSALLVAASAAVYFGGIMIANVVGSITAAVGAAAAYQISLGASTTATVVMGTATTALAGAFTVLSRALMLTGIGALVVLAGYLITRFLDLVRATGGFGEAMTLLGEVASGVWEGIKTGATSIPPALNGLWESVKAGFFQMLSDLSNEWMRFLSNFSDSIPDLPGFGWAITAVGDAAGRAADGMGRFDAAAVRAGVNAGVLKDEAAALAAAGLTTAKDAMQKLTDAVAGTDDAVKPLTPEVINLGNGVAGAGDKAKKAASEFDKFLQRIKALNAEAAKGTTPMEKYNIAMAELQKMQRYGLTDAAYSQEVKKLNEQLANSLPMVNDLAQAFSDFVMRGFKDFKGFAQAILASFKKMIAEMIMVAARNRIMLSITGGGSVMGTAASAAGSGILGGMGSLLGIGGGLGSGALAGLASGVGGILSGGGLGASFANLGGLLSGSVSGMGALGAALPALGVIAAPFVLMAALKKKRTLLDSGISAEIGLGSADVEQYKTVNTKRFFGLSSKTRTTSSAASADVADPIRAAVNDVQGSVMKMAEVFGYGADAFEGFSYSFKLSLKGLSEADAMARVTEELNRMGDAFASMLPHFSSMNELIAATEDRWQLENRLLGLQGRDAELLARQRERELAATHVLNQAILMQIYALEDQAVAAEQAAQALELERRAREAFMSDIMGSGQFRTAADREFVATGYGFREGIQTLIDPEEKALLLELLEEIRAGNINNARLSTRQILALERQILEQEGTAV